MGRSGINWVAAHLAVQAGRFWTGRAWGLDFFQGARLHGRGPLGRRRWRRVLGGNGGSSAARLRALSTHQSQVYRGRLLRSRQRQRRRYWIASRLTRAFQRRAEPQPFTNSRGWRSLVYSGHCNALCRNRGWAGSASKGAKSSPTLHQPCAGAEGLGIAVGTVIYKLNSMIPNLARRGNWNRRKAP